MPVITWPTMARLQPCGAGAAGSNTSPWNPGTFSGEIVICDRGTYGRVEKGINASSRWRRWYGFGRQRWGSLLDGHALPATHISQADGVALKAWVAGNTNAMATISGSIVDYSPSNADIMAGFSSRGPVGIFDVLKPDMTAPGVGIWAAVNDDGSGPPDYDLLSGTSMSSPHDAGAAALMAALYPTWSPHQIKSAMMLAADTVDNVKEDGTTPADPFDLGNGRIDVSAASNVGFVLDETTANFEAADPALNNGSSSALRNLNLASMSNDNCVGGCSWTRTVESVLSGAATYTATVSAPAGITVTVSPPTFTLAAGASQALTFNADVSGAALGDWEFASVSFETDATQPALNAVNAVVLSEDFEGELSRPPVGRLSPILAPAGTQMFSGAGLTSLQVQDRPLALMRMPLPPAWIRPCIHLFLI
ncbi:MAG: S8 family serine peptidase [Chloroflexi bacterium]|nr:S8 family serine peptidase [Chloroflexota bacterium]